MKFCCRIDFDWELSREMECYIFESNSKKFFSRVKYRGAIFFLIFSSPVFQLGVGRFVRFLLLLLNLVQHLFFKGEGVI